MINEFTPLRTAIENDIQQMKTAVNSNTAPVEITDTSESHTLITFFKCLYYELAGVANVHQLTISPPMDAAASSFLNQTCSLYN